MATTFTFLQTAIDPDSTVFGIQRKVRESHRLGFGKHCPRVAVALNRIIVSGASGGRRFVHIEPDTRHVELILKSLGLLKPSNVVVTPGTRHTSDQVERRKKKP